MRTTETTRMPDPELVERVMAAIDAGCQPTVGALAEALREPAATIAVVLELVQRYRECIDRERSASRPLDPLDTDALPASTQIGDFRLDHVLGRGAMGVVYAARQMSLGQRPVALKVLPRLLVARDPRFVQRFRREAALAATIHHPNMAEVYGFEEAGDTLCFAMRRVDGPTLHAVLADVADGNQGPVRRTSVQHVAACVHLVRGLAAALAAIHERGLVHRDVKPSNVMLEGAVAPGASPLSATPVLVDFGLLRPAGDTDLTGTQTMIGTPAYASYEAQVGRDLDARADVFSLGAVFHDLLTSTPPGTRGPASAGLPNVRAVNPTVDARLAAIVAMALQEKKDLRYEHGGALRDELDRYLRGEPLRALPTRWLGRLRLWARRDPVRAMRIGAATAVPAALIAVLFVWFAATAWSLQRAAAAGAELERQGDLLGAAAAYRELYQAGGQAHILPGLSEAIEQAEIYGARGGAMQQVLANLADGATKLAEDPDNPRAAELDYALAHHRLCRLLLGQSSAAAAPIRAFLLREAISGEPQFRQRLALDSWANVLIAEQGRQTLPEGVEAALWGLFGPEARKDLLPDTRQAAAVACGSICTFDSFCRLIDLCADPDVEVCKSATTCTWYVYSWLHKDLPAEYAQITNATMERWGAAAEAAGARCGVELASSIARHLAWWERPLTRESSRPPLALSTPLRTLVDDQARQLAAEWAAAGQRLESASDHFQVTAGIRAEQFDAAIWTVDADQQLFRRLAGPVAGNAEARTGTVRFEYGDGRSHRALVDGTIREIVARGAEITAWENRAQAPYLLFDRPGHSLLRIRSAVPATADRLTIRILHMNGVRPVLRNGGEVVLRHSLAGLRWEHTSLAPGSPNRDGRPRRNDHISTELDVPPHVFDAVRDVTFEIEYLYGNTSHRILEVTFEWELGQVK
jgi:tRNA A-37 threonylcarbamoyl transferase component Bud32